jgi:hypothetical protein
VEHRVGAGEGGLAADARLDAPVALLKSAGVEATAADKRKVMQLWRIRSCGLVGKPLVLK